LYLEAIRQADVFLEVAGKTLEEAMNSLSAVVRLLARLDP
jgi:hypothetical protein